jgi:3-oxoacyl-(acyl-carrier-protein) synthase/NAD(P)-dependent dehydrogenase (short-subunit alcohol dehydrogenase family)
MGGKKTAPSQANDDAILMQAEEAINELPPTDELQVTEQKQVLEQEIDKNGVEYSQIPHENIDNVPVAIVAMGGIFPCSKTIDDFWQNLMQGKDCISDINHRNNPHDGADFMAGDATVTPPVIVPDKTYSGMSGVVHDADVDAYYAQSKTLSTYYSTSEFKQISHTEKLLAIAIDQLLLQYPKETLLKHTNIDCIIGGTADGIEAFDERRFLNRTAEIISGLDTPDTAKTNLLKHLSSVSGYETIQDLNGLLQHHVFSRIVNKMLGKDVCCYIIDSACSSSIYSVDSAIQKLRQHQSDLILAGGAYGASIANSALFAQFRGLSPKGSRPFDVDSDGVIFGDGAGLLALKRLPDAIKDGDTIMGVIREIGTSSDGKSPAVNVPQSNGQLMSVHRAFNRSKIPANSIQYLEFHATSTQVGDSTEFNGVKAYFEEHKHTLNDKINIGSVKANISHTGWSSGVASIIKICKAFDAKMMPPQINFSSPSPKIDLANSPFTISTQAKEWAENHGHLPRRAGINSFGFGGTNAHLIIEEYSAPYHQALCEHNDFKTAAEHRDKKEFVISNVASLFPSKTNPSADTPDNTQVFDRSKLRSPKKMIILPDVTDDMDPSQFVILLTIEKLLAAFPDWKSCQDDIGTFIGMEDKTQKGTDIVGRVFRDRLRRWGKTNVSQEDTVIFTNMIEEVCGAYDNIKQSGPYTLPGLMPNVTSGRAANLFNLHGANFVIDEGKQSLTRALSEAMTFIAEDKIKLVICGGVNTHILNSAHDQEGCFLMALTSKDYAIEKKLPILAHIKATSTPSHTKATAPTKNLRGATNSDILANFFHTSSEKTLSLALTKRGQVHTSLEITKKESNPPADIPKGFIQNTPIYTCTPVLCAVPRTEEKINIKNESLLILADHSTDITAINTLFEGSTYTLITPQNLPKATPENLAKLISDTASVSSIIAIKQLAPSNADDLLVSIDNDRWLLDSLYITCQHYYESIKTATIKVAGLSFNAQYSTDALHPYSGLIAGFFKALQRELPAANIRVISSTQADLNTAISALEYEFCQPHKVGEVVYKESKRHVFKLQEVAQPSQTGTPLLDSTSVVLATGGGRGVTAVLCEELLEKYGCTVIAVGRTPLEGVPQHYLEMTEAAFKDHEAQFYKEKLKEVPKKSIKDIKKLYLSYLAANEIYQNTQRLNTLPGSFSYMSCNILDETLLADLIRDIRQQWGDIHYVLHGAGTQVSQQLSRKPLGTFQSIINTKLSSLNYIYSQLNTLQPAIHTHYHLLTSAFSYMGNDGQPDYGAANEAMNRLAECLTSSHSNWSTSAWLGWANIGMTRGSEFTALAISRGLRGVTKEEGKAYYRSLLQDTPTHAANIQMADGEIKAYAIDMLPVDAKTSTASANAHEYTLIIAPTDIPILENHIVNGHPTLPAAFSTCLIIDEVKKAFPQQKIIEIKNASFSKFIRPYKNQDLKIKVKINVISSSDYQKTVQVQLLSDFVHHSGMVLKSDILHVSAKLLLSDSMPAAAPSHPTDFIVNYSMQDPYVMPGTPMVLTGPFKSLSDISIGDDYRKAHHNLDLSQVASARFSHLLPLMFLFDAMSRFGAAYTKENGTAPIYVPLSYQNVKSTFDLGDFNNTTLMSNIRFMGKNPVIRENLLTVVGIQAVDNNDNVLVEQKEGLCQFNSTVDITNKKEVIL